MRINDLIFVLVPVAAVDLNNRAQSFQLGRRPSRKSMKNRLIIRIVASKRN